MVTQSRPRLVDLYPADYDAIRSIRERLELSSDALAIRQAIRSLAARLSQPEQLRDPVRNKPALGEQHD